MIDWNLIKSYKQECGQELIDELYFCFDNEVPERLTHAFDALEGNEKARLEGLLHALKNSFLNVGATIEGNYCQALEDQLTNLPEGEIRMGLRKIQLSADRVRRELRLAPKTL